MHCQKQYHLSKRRVHETEEIPHQRITERKWWNLDWDRYHNDYIKYLPAVAASGILYMGEYKQNRPANYRSIEKVILTVKEFKRIFLAIIFHYFLNFCWHASLLFKQVTGFFNQNVTFRH